MPANLFNVNFYRALNPDLAGLTDEQASSHFFNFGLNEGRIFSPFVNLQFYQARNPDLAVAGLTSNQQLFQHLQDFGVAEGRAFSPYLDLDFYLANNPDVNQAFAGNREQTFHHLQNYGLNEGRIFSPLIDLNFYLASNSDVAAFYGNNRFVVLQHLQSYGLTEGRAFSPFVDLNFYLASNPDVNQAFGGDRQLALQHLQTYGLDESRKFTPFFDFKYYKANNPDLIDAGLNNTQLLQHFQMYGLYEGRVFSPVFDLNYYRSLNPDLVAAGLDQRGIYEHFQRYGLTEGRLASPNFNVQVYLANNPDLVGAGFNYQQAYEHYLLFGQGEGRPGSDYAGSSFASARLVGLGTTPDSITDFVGTSDAADWYQFTLDRAGDWRRSLNVQNGAVTLQLAQDINNNGAIEQSEILQGFTATPATTLSDASGILEAGAYYVKAAPANAETNTNYALSLSINPSPLLTNNTGIALTSGSAKTIGSDQLRVVDADTDATQLIYTVKDAPLNGSLQLNGSVLSVNQTFTQEDINQGQVSYQSNGGSASSDRFNFSVTDGTTTLNNSFNFNLGRDPYLVKDINSGLSSSSPQSGRRVVDVNGTLYFSAYSPDWGLWKSDGTEVGTTLVKQNGSPWANVNGSLYFLVNYYSTEFNRAIVELWKSDGTDAGATFIKSLSQNYWLTPLPSKYNVAVIGNTLYFSETENRMYGSELWKSDGTPKGTVPLTDMNPDRGSLDGYILDGYAPVIITNTNNTLYFISDRGGELWKSDGTTEGTVLVKKDVSPVSNLSFANVNDTLYFIGYDEMHGTELWKSDGTTEGTVLVKDINPDEGSSLFNWDNLIEAEFTLINVNGTLYFEADDGIHGAELWKSDGTTEGTVLVKDINPGANSSNPAYLTAINNTLYFSSNDGVHGAELWKSDGTTEGTVLVKDINPGANSSNPEALINFDGMLYFGASDPVHGKELWKSDGTALGTALVEDINLGVNSSWLSSYSRSYNFVQSNHKLFFWADDGIHGTELWAIESNAVAGQTGI